MVIDDVGGRAIGAVAIAMWMVGACASTKGRGPVPVDALRSSECAVIDEASEAVALGDDVPEPPGSAEAARRAFEKALGSGDPEQIRRRAWSFVYGYCGDEAATATILEALVALGGIAVERERPEVARAFFEKVIELYRARGGEAGASEAGPAARAQFRKGELKFRELQKLSIDGDIESQKKDLKRIVQLNREVQQAYQKVYDYEVLEWTLAAGVRTGDLFRDFAGKINAVSIPFEDEETARLYRCKLRDIASPLRDRAMKRYREVVEKATQEQLESRWVEEARRGQTKLEEMSMRQCPQGR